MGEREINFEMLWNALLKEVGFKVGFEESIGLQKLAMGEVTYQVEERVWA